VDGEAMKRAAASAAADLVESGMLLGLGSGSTAAQFVRVLGERLQAGVLRGVRGVPTSQATAALAARIGIELIDLPASGVDLAIDGMDEVDARLDAVKGLGGAATREKIVAASASRFVLIGDESKVVDELARRTPVPVEVLAFGFERTRSLLIAAGSRPTLRGGAEPFLTDEGNPILDCALQRGVDPAAFAQALDATPGVVGHGLFLGLASAAIIAGAGGVRRL
jgi:ribose 5-phosphate isomerase A